jgi:hypothetical protein
LFTAWHETQSASLPLLPSRIAYDYEVVDEALDPRLPSELKVGEGVPPPLCAGRCASPPAGPVCALNAAGTARTFATLCELEAVSCRESTCMYLFFWFFTNSRNGARLERSIEVSPELQNNTHHHHHLSRETSTAGHRPPPKSSTTIGLVLPSPSADRRSTLWGAYQGCVSR